MTAAPSRRPVRRTALVAAALVLVLAGCGAQKEPGSYTSGVKTDFTSGCWTTLIADVHPKTVSFVPTDNRSKREEKATKGGTKAEVKLAKQYCGCVYGKLTKDVKFGEFKSVNDDLRNDAGPLPPSFQKAYKSCKLDPTLAS